MNRSDTPHMRWSEHQGAPAPARAPTQTPGAGKRADGPPAPRPPQGPTLPPLPGRTRGPEAPKGAAQNSRRWPWLAGGFAALALAGALVATLVLGGDTAEVSPPPPPLVEIATAEPAGTIAIRQTGFLTATAEVEITPEVAGRIAEVSDTFRRGAFVEEGAMLVRLQTRQIRATVAEARAGVARAETALAEARVEQQRQSQLQNEGFASEARLQTALVAVASAEADLTAARARLVTARTRLEDAILTAPFDALVTQSTADPGALASPGQSLGTLVAASSAEVELGLTPADLAILGNASRAVGGRVRLRPASAATGAGQTAPLAYGIVARVGPGIDAATRTVPLIIRIPDPFAAERSSRPLRIDELLELELPVSLANRDASRVPARAVKGGTHVWRLEPVAGSAPGGEADTAPTYTLRRMPITLVQRTDSAVIVEGELSPGTPVLLSDIAGMAEGLTVRARSNARPGPGVAE